MTDRQQLLIEGLLVLAIVGLFAAVWCYHSTASACEPDLPVGKVCPDQVPATFSRVCADGCYLVHPDDLRAFKVAQVKAELIPRLRASNYDLKVVVGNLQRQRDEATVAARLLGEEVDLKLEDLAACKGEVAAAPSWSTVLVGGAVGVVIGGIAAVVLWVAM